jgi:hypothetical protein
MKDEMKSHVIILAVVIMTVLFSGACGSGGGSGGAPPPPPPPPDANEWTWMNGASAFNQPGTYGSQGTAGTANVPGARELAVSWTDASGNFWLFGGNGYDSTGNGGDLDDLWKYSAGEWTWMSGSNTRNQPATYGTLGVAASNNVPGARWGVAGWIDASGGLWLLGGASYDNGLLNDLWNYNAGEWTWVGGSNMGNQSGVYGTQGTAGSDNIPGARYTAVSWTDASGNLWLFAGNGYDSTGNNGTLNDLWKYSAGEWAWMSGSNVVDNQGIYGTQGMAAASNVPGARNSSVGWIDASGNLWLFGGLGYDSTGAEGNLNDLWKYSVIAGEWTWVGGSNVGGHSGTYGTQGTASPNNVPGARYGAVGWTDASGNFWLFGGTSYNPNTATGGWFNDLWKYSAGEWTWVDGSNVTNQAGIYGNEGTAAAGNIPGARFASVSWTDTSGNLWLFGGYGVDSTAEGYLNDLWKYEP